MIERFNGDFLQWLRGFYAVVETGNVSLAAERLGLRQPAVSHLLRSLETELGVSLFSRNNKSMVLTAEGHQLYDKTVSLFEMVKDIQAEVGRTDRLSVKGEISLVTTHSVAINILPPHIRRFRATHPQTYLAITAAAESGFVVDKVCSAALDFGIIMGDGFPESIVARPLFTTRLVLAAPKNMEFTRNSEGYLNDIAEIHGIPYIHLSTATLLERTIQAELEAKGVFPDRAVVANNSSILKTYVAAGLGVTIIEEFTVADARERLNIYPLPHDAAMRTYYLITRHRKYIPSQSLAFIDDLLQHNQTDTPVNMV